jgi:hypothetical protein
MHDRSEGVAVLEGGRAHPGERFELFQANWSPATRLLLGVAGGALALKAVGRGRLGDLVLGGLALGMASRGPASGGQRRAAGKTGAGRATRGRHPSGWPDGGQGRTDEVGRSGVYPASGPFPSGPAQLRSPDSFVHGQRDESGRQVEGGSEPTYLGHGVLLGGATPPSSSLPQPHPDDRTKRP